MDALKDFYTRIKIETFSFEEIPTGFLLHLNETGIGVAAPLYGYSLESRQEAKYQLCSLCTDLKGENLSAAEVGRLPLFPSVMFAMQSALLPKVPNNCAIQGLWMGQEMQNHSVIKIKVGNYSIEDVLTLIQKFPMRLRLDFNQKWSLEKATCLAKHVSWDKIDYFEEPLKDPTELIHFPYPIALDETLRIWPLENIQRLPHIAALVIKPTLLGNILPFIKLGLPLVLSSCFEGKEGVDILAQLAHRLGIADQPQGLDTVKCL